MRELTESEIHDVLAGNGVGVLALDGGVYPYPVPVAFGFDSDDDQLVVQLEESDDSEKTGIIEENPEVGFTVYEETEPGQRWRSVVVRGELVETAYEAAEPAFAALARTTATAPNPVRWGERGTVTPYELRVRDRTGREFRLG